MAGTELIDVRDENAKVRARERAKAAVEARDICGASSTDAFLNAMDWYQDRIAEIERKGFCLACGGALVAESVCTKCGRDNS
jgi:hypothetical protein